MVCTGCGIIGADARPNWKEQLLRDDRSAVADVNASQSRRGSFR
jgi:hypothetical protein